MDPIILDFYDIRKLLGASRYKDITKDEIDNAYILISKDIETIVSRSHLQKVSSRINRNPNEKKVPPGSNLVERSYTDDRFLLCSYFILKSMIYERRNDCSNVILSLRCALQWFPKSIEAIQRLTLFLRTQADSPDSLLIVEQTMRRGVQLTEQLSILTNQYNVDRSIVLCELENGRMLRENLALLLYQSNRCEEANVLLGQLGYTWTLSPDVRSYHAVSLIVS